MLYLGAVTLGALHAFEPGHGKTLIAAYMIGTRGRAVDGMLLGLIVTFTHTFSVILLGIVARLLSTSYSETELHAWLGLFSAILILIVGIWMLKQRLGKDSGHLHFHLFGKGHHHAHDAHTHSHAHHAHLHQQDDHAHPHDHVHDHDHHHDHDHDHHHPHDHVHGSAAGAGTVCQSKWNLIQLGVSGGLVPCPAAIATLLVAIGAGRTAEGLTMVLFFSLGLGLVMMAIGVFLSRARTLTERFSANQEFSRKMGLLSAIIITALGAYTLFHSVRSVLSL